MLGENYLNELKLDESKIRKGKPIGLPYIGSKKKISKKIVEIIKQNFGSDKTIYDLFGGGGAITFECLINGLDVVYNDIDPLIGQAIQIVLNEDREFLKELIVPREEFYAIKAKENKTPEDKLKLLVNSFGNNEKDYLYSKKYSDAKYVIAREIIQKHDCFGDYKKTDTFKKVKDKAVQFHRIEGLERIEQIHQVQNAVDLCGVTFSSNDYNHYSDITNSILYLDPLYSDITRNRYNTHKFDRDEFHKWCIDMSKNNIVLISEYSVPHQFECVFEFRKAKPTIQNKGQQYKYEKLFMVK